MSAPYSFLRPLLSPSGAWAAFDWQMSRTEAVEGSEISALFAESGAAALAEKMPFIIPTDPDWLGQSEFAEKIKPDQVIFSLPPGSLDSAESLARCQALRSGGFHCALHVESAGTIARIPPDAFDYLTFDAAFLHHRLPGADLIHAARSGFRKIARGASSHEIFTGLSGKGIELCDSSFLTVPNPDAGKEPDLTRLKLLKLLSLIAQDADTRSIEEIFREDPKLSYNLLRLVNSVSVGAKTSIDSFHQAIAILGRRQLQRWLQLLIYANQLSHSGEPNPLMQLAAARGRQMELLLAAVEPAIDIEAFGDTAFMTGIFSLLNILLNLPMQEILDALPLQKTMRDALNSRQGLLGDLLGAIIAGESGDFPLAVQMLSQNGISPLAHATAQTAALFWASGINLD